MATACGISHSRCLLHKIKLIMTELAKIDSTFLGESESGHLDSEESRFDRIIGGAERVGSGVGNIWGNIAQPTTDLLSIFRGSNSGGGSNVYIQQGISAGRALTYTAAFALIGYGAYRIIRRKKK